MYAQRVNAQPIHDVLQEELKICECDSLFDDEHFTKSTTYHLAVKTCDALEASIATSLRFLQRTLDGQINQLCREAHHHEKLGLEHWSQKLDEEVYALEDLQTQIRTLCLQVQEKVREPNLR